eukprot:CAMPEP_0197043408 /NCGR_PEP_ID=MMETSP1384-20130603/19670_1 /TAXON_ID=29189 /ORGANISM="Ammonia sp." /LENGTH=76 /DNA_ID=CAMNT_0042474709 /DNA_START=112 /DNA_END=342 /DNA_ORIENTATION=-
MSSRKRGRGNRRLRLEKAMQEQRALESELERLNTAQNQKEIAQQIKDLVVKNGPDPMLSEENPFKQNNEGCPCSIM